MTWHLVIGPLIKTQETNRAIWLLTCNNICFRFWFCVPHFPSSFLANLSLSLSLSLSRTLLLFLCKFPVSLLVYAVLFFIYLLISISTVCMFKAIYFFVDLKLESPLQLGHSSFFHFILLLFLFFFETHFFKFEDFLFRFFGFLSKTQFSVYICAWVTEQMLQPFWEVHIMA